MLMPPIVLSHAKHRLYVEDKHFMDDLQFLQHKPRSRGVLMQKVF